VTAKFTPQIHSAKEVEYTQRLHNATQNEHGLYAQSITIIKCHCTQTSAVPNIHSVFALVPNTGRNSLLVFGWIVHSEQIEIDVSCASNSTTGKHYDTVCMTISSHWVCDLHFYTCSASGTTEHSILTTADDGLGPNFLLVSPFNTMLIELQDNWCLRFCRHFLQKG